MPAIEGLGVNPVELAHAIREIAIRGFNHQMVVVDHQAVGVTEPMKSLRNLGEGVKKKLPVGVVFENWLSFVASGGDVIQRAVVSIRKGRAMVLNPMRLHSKCQE
jgi:hypothetical protein